MLMTVGVWVLFWLLVFGAVAAVGWLIRPRRSMPRDQFETRRRDRAA